MFIFCDSVTHMAHYKSLSEFSKKTQLCHLKKQICHLLLTQVII